VSKQKKEKKVSDREKLYRFQQVIKDLVRRQLKRGKKASRRQQIKSFKSNRKCSYRNDVPKEIIESYPKLIFLYISAIIAGLFFSVFHFSTFFNFQRDTFVTKEKSNSKRRRMTKTPPPLPPEHDAHSCFEENVYLFALSRITKLF
jgi:hypothetical protein